MRIRVPASAKERNSRQNFESAASAT
jgi:hypothetical protein